MSKTLKTYPDGSEFTTTHVAVIVGVALATTVVYLGVTEVTTRILHRRMIKKAVHQLKN